MAFSRLTKLIAKASTGPNAITVNKLFFFVIFAILLYLISVVRGLCSAEISVEPTNIVKAKKLRDT